MSAPLKKDTLSGEPPPGGDSVMSAEGIVGSRVRDVEGKEAVSLSGPL